jgi:hypothetical protein
VTPADVLQQVLEAGGQIVPDPARPRLLGVPENLKPLVLEHREALRALVLAKTKDVTYCYPWPDVLPGLGARHVGPFDPCADCVSWSWVRYGDLVLCLDCARRRAGADGVFQGRHRNAPR